MTDSGEDQASKAAAAAGRSAEDALAYQPGVVRLVAHRGAGFGQNDPTGPPENTLAAIEYGFQQGADAVEVDVWCTKDGVPILHHDATTGRTTDLPDVAINSLSLDEVRRLNAGAWKSDRWAGETVPTLAAATALVPSRGALVVEIEEGPQVVEKIVETLIGSSLIEEQIVIISYNWDTAAAVKRIAPQLRVLWILNTMPLCDLGGWAQGHRRGQHSRPTGFEEQADSRWIVDTAEAAGLDGIDTLFAYPPDLPNLAADRGLKWMVWTVNDPRAVSQCLGDGAWAITTDNPGTLAMWLSAAGIPTVSEAGVSF